MGRVVEFLKGGTCDCGSDGFGNVVPMLAQIPQGDPMGKGLVRCLLQRTLESWVRQSPRRRMRWRSVFCSRRVTRSPFSENARGATTSTGTSEEVCEEHLADNFLLSQRLRVTILARLFTFGFVFVVLSLRFVGRRQDDTFGDLS